MKKDDIGRRSFLRSCTAVGLSTTLAGLTSASNGDQIATLDTSEYDTLDTVEITPTPGGAYHVRMGGTVDPGTGSRGYSLRFENTDDVTGTSVTDAGPTLETLPEDDLPSPDRSTTRETDSRVETSSGVDKSDGVSSYDGGDNESDYEGGCWVRSEDPPDLDLCKTDHWMDWNSNGGYDARGHWETWEYTVPPSDWNHNSSSFADVDTEPAAESKYVVDYINWTWQWNDVKTEAFHRTYLTGYSDGSMDWETTQWHTGEDSGLLRTDTGHHSNADI